MKTGHGLTAEVGVWIECPNDGNCCGMSHSAELRDAAGHLVAVDGGMGGAFLDRYDLSQFCGGSDSGCPVHFYDCWQ